MSVRLINDTTYVTGNEGQKYRAVFSENGLLQSKSVSTLYTANASRPFYLAENAHAHYIRPRGGKRPFCFSFSEKTASSCVSCYFL